MKLQSALPAGFLTPALAFLLLLPLFSQISPAQAEGAATTPEPVQLPAGVSEGMLISKVPPNYPPLAKQARIQGTVILDAVIDKDGAVQQLHLIQGHPMLAPAAMDAVKQWKYKPYLSNGKPVEVETKITVNFKLAGLKTEDSTGSASSASAQAPEKQPIPQAASNPDISGTGSGSGSGAAEGGGHGAGISPGGSDLGGGVYHVGGGVSAPKLIDYPQPEFPEEERKTKHEGVVVLEVIVGADGRVKDLQVTRSLSASFDEKAMEAVKTWRFEPSMKDGRPVPVVVNVNVNFRLY